MNDLALALDSTHDFLTRYIRFPSPHEPVAVSLFVGHTWTVDAAEHSPYLAITSPEKRSGKSRLIECLRPTVCRPWVAITPSEAVLFWKLEQDHPTLMLDEADTLFGSKKAAEQNEGLRGILNAGNRRGTTVPRIVVKGKEFLVTEFDCFGPKVLAGIGTLPDTITDRSVLIRMERRARGEPIERFRARDAEMVAIPIREWWGALSDQLVRSLTDARPLLPDQLGDRAQDGWEALLAIAELAGEDWTHNARAAAVALSGERLDEMDDASLPLVLLSDMRDAFLARDADRLLSFQLIEDLVANEERPWGDYRGKPISAHAIGRMLHTYRVRPVQFRVGGRETNQARGYLRADLEPVWDRYLPPIRNTASDRHTVTPEATQARSDADACDGVTLNEGVTDGTGFDPETATDDDGEPDALLPNVWAGMVPDGVA